LIPVLFQVCPSLLDDEDPIPLYTLKLVVALLEANPLLIHSAAQLGLAPRFFAFLSLEHTNNNVHNVRLCRMVVAATAPGGGGSMVPDDVLAAHNVGEKVCVWVF
jgi:serine/threonine-protein kinase ULK4